MERKPEQKVWDAMSAGLRPWWAVINLTRFENVAGDGAGDVLSIARPHGVVTWVELKAAPVLPARATTRLLRPGKGLRLSQRNFAVNWRNYNGRYFVLCGIEPLREFILVSGRHADSVNDWTLEQWRINSVTFGRDKQFFEGLARVLQGLHL